MEFNHIHFYVQDAKRTRDWFIQNLGFQGIGSRNLGHTQTEIVCQGSVYFLLSSPLTIESPVTEFLQFHPSGVADVAFEVKDLELRLEHLIKQGVRLIYPLKSHDYLGGQLKWLTIEGWQGLRHTLIEQIGTILGKPIPGFPDIIPRYSPDILNIDHVVLNVESGDLKTAISWYQNNLGFQPKQSFDIQTERSGLQSQVMVHSQGQVQLPINEPASKNSQIQEFLDINRGSGIQHIALKTLDLVQKVNHLKRIGLSFLTVPDEYYLELQKRWNHQPLLVNWEALKVNQILADWEPSNPEAMLLQIFTQPIFEQPTFFFEFIERKICTIQGQIRQAQGFGEGNFRALFEAIEREQIKRANQTYSNRE
ncbi:MAG TPA: 4-hydroxyphenylpyruvate dioxygenase [Planktothrix sp. UBA8407]|nr:4-hydroxyphenylpyruvate dioxygenase [Planktothrix sp. UBA8407]HBK24530.1 4-hydroxyphenylpyruvate dioxygenase [Planktothrix sp. UBA10369]